MCHIGGAHLEVVVVDEEEEDAHGGEGPAKVLDQHLLLTHRSQKRSSASDAVHKGLGGAAYGVCAAAMVTTDNVRVRGGRAHASGGETGDSSGHQKAGNMTTRGH
jgi:hypothetical protein